jgi:hypothetical protein
MGRLKERLLNNLNENYMDDMFDLSAFEYVELVERYKETETKDEYVPTDEEMQKLEQMVQDYYNSKEFREYVENYNPIDGLSEEQIDAAFLEHNLDEDELERINDSVQLKYTDGDILDVLDDMIDPQKMDIILARLNDIWNTKRGLF